MVRQFLIACAALAILPFCADARARETLSDLLDRSDAAGLAAYAQTASPAEAELARGVAAALHRDDAAALAPLRAAGDNAALPPALRRDAWRAAADVYLRQTRFGDAAAAMERARTFGEVEDDEMRAAGRQALAFAQALANEPAMTFTVAPAGEIAVQRDMAQLARANVTINGQTQEAILDTGAGYSLVNESTAERLGLRFIEGANVTVGSSSTRDAPARLAYGEHLSIGGGEFHHVVFIVMPDAALSFGGGAYVIEAIIGLPVLAQLGRLEFASGDGGEVMRHGRSPHQRGPDSNLVLSGLQPLATLKVGDARLTMLLDTGARGSHLSPRAIERHPEIAEGAVTRSVRMGGAGGTVEQDAPHIPRVTFDIEGVAVALEDVSVLPHPAGEHDGLIGQDIMRAGRAYVIDFDAMRFEVLK